MTSYLKDISALFCIFILINGFYITDSFNSTFLVFPFIFIFSLLIKRNVFFIFFSLVKKKIIFSLVMYLLFLLCMNLIIIMIHHTYDFSYSKNILSLFIQLLCVVFFISYLIILYPFPQSESFYTFYIGKLICMSFVIQSLIEILAFLNPSVADLVHFFYSQSQYELLYKGYQGIRGLALTGSPGWGLAVGYAFSFLFYTRYYLCTNKVNIVTIIYGFLLVVGAFFAGRSAFLGVILSFIFYLFSDLTFKSKFFVVLKILFCFIIVSIIVYFLLFDFLLLLEEKVFPFVFEMFYNLDNNGQLSTGSTDVLIDMWNIDIPDNTEILGTGWFTDPLTGSYYLKTDVGYIRNYLFGGFVWLCCIYSFGCYIFLRMYNYATRHLDKLLVILCFLLPILFDVKAITLAFSKYYFIISMLYLFCLYLDREAENV